MSENQNLDKPGSGRERRNYKRYSKEVVSYFEVIQSPDDINTAGKMKTQDISAGGILFEGMELLQVGTILKVELALPGFEKPKRLMARVVRVEEIEAYEKYEVGVAFFNINDEQKEFIKQLIEK